ncbi:thiol reductant ABC exporter subunit CydD [Halobacillus locisalis]|uniref:Thiol reductant ABC exporter subunit CydD n=1 Tax=Halobacillus locisalis TaxID=220753 RepID=A0A838CXN1_9BACI|nr:thiol reductant ABC exporter subunit CydD [Halobacillus locisalis]MBA2176589.1 thiol reductant ABC exporter subunit CydD [Halobacillus locisalis]
MKHLSQIAFGQRKAIFLLTFASVLIGATIIGQSYFFVAIVKRVFLDNQSFQDIIPLLLGLFAVLSGRALFTWLHGRTGVSMAAYAKKQFRERILNKFSRNPVQASLQGQSGRKVSVLMDAVDEVDGYFSQYVPQMISTAIVPIMILVVVFTQHVTSGIIMLITAPFIPFFMAIVGVMTKKKSEEQMEKMSAFSGRFLDTLQGLTTLKLFGKSKRQRDVIEESSLGFRDATMDVLKVAFISSLMLEFISMLSIGIIALEIAIRLVVYESIPFFSAFFILVLAPEFYLTLKDFGSAFHTGRGSSGAANQLAEELEKEEQSMEWGEQELAVQQPPELNLDGVTFSYDSGHDFQLNDVQALIPSKSQVAIVGRSGSGKSTLLNLIAGLMRPSEGSVKVNGRPLNDYQEREWFKQLSYISQNPYLFAGTIEDNIAIGGRGDHTREEVEQAAKKAGISELIESLEQGYDTPIGEAGRGLSGGEKQRLAIARAFLKQPSVILFDEPTTGLDLRTEQILQSSIEELSQTSTVITVAHRLHTIRKADHILFLDNGRLVAAGKHEELLERAEEYRQMVDVQQGGDTA